MSSPSHRAASHINALARKHYPKRPDKTTIPTKAQPMATNPTPDMEYLTLSISKRWWFPAFMKVAPLMVWLLGYIMDADRACSWVAHFAASAGIKHDIVPANK